LDVNELRVAFSLCDSLGEKVRAFRLNRIGAILNGELTVQLPPGPKIVLHICPTVSFRPGFQIDLHKVYSLPSPETQPMTNNSSGSHYNFDGLFTKSTMDGADCAYVQTFRNGCFESVDTTLLRSRDGKPYFPSIAFEKQIVQCGNRLVALLKRLNVEPPYIAMLTFLGVRGFFMYVDPSRSPSTGAHPVERDNLYLDDILIEDAQKDFGYQIRPAFDQVWNACGWPKSWNYDSDGNWRAYRQ
jgi:hypothetical protein